MPLLSDLAGSDLAEHVNTVVGLLGWAVALLVGAISLVWRTHDKRIMEKIDAQGTLLSKEISAVMELVTQQHEDEIRRWEEHSGVHREHNVLHQSLEDRDRIQNSKISAVATRLAYIEGRFITETEAERNRRRENHTHIPPAGDEGGGD